MSNGPQLIGELILQHKNKIAQQIHDERMAQVQMTSAQNLDFQKIEQHVIDTRVKFIQIFGESLAEQLDSHTSSNKIKKWAEENGNYFFSLGADLDESLKDTSFYRDYLWKFIRHHSIKNQFSAETIFKIRAIIDPLLDTAVYHFGHSYVTSLQQSLESARTSYLALSVPVVPLGPSTGILPLLGAIDTERAHYLMEETLSQAEKLHLDHLIIDLSGVSTIDTMVANQLFRIIESLDLIGVETIITGIRPEISHTMVSLGLKPSHLKVKGNLQQALKEFNF
ncbi:STAS domain-containing protein [Halobacillus halophilus]|uniref:STAS domain-containing protein n=1 Tax=Halobacillus halophilus TaxID=1570 RepID=UPI001CD6213C|nr:STAS domain-containing protein [Halobacillus halophilus]MCA1009125.1 STAS domain-containing protein [Halobacillus halophilus]